MPNHTNDDARAKLVTKYGGTKFLADYIAQDFTPAHAGDTPAWSNAARRRDWYVQALTAAAIPFPAGGHLADLASLYWKNVTL